MKKIFLISTFMVILASITISCNDDKLMYNTAQKDHLYHITKNQNDVASFVFDTDDTIERVVEFSLMGMPRNEDRTFSIEFLEPTTDNITVGTDVVGVVKAREDIDFEVEEIIVPAGEVTGHVKLKINRQDVMADNYVSIRFQVVECDEFKPVVADSTELDEIFNSICQIYVSDGEVACPYWWDSSSSRYDLKGWIRNMGTFYPAKYRKFLQYYWALEQEQPIIYQMLEEKYGRYMEKEEIRNSFFYTNSSVWAAYVLVPLYNELKEFHKNNPDDPNNEVYLDSGYGTSGEYWANPITLLR